MLGHPHRHHRQLLELMTRRLTDRDMLALGEHVPAVAAIRPVLDHFVDHPRRQRRPTLALAPGLITRPSTGPILAALGRPRGSWLGGREELRDERLMAA